LSGLSIRHGPDEPPPPTPDRDAIIRTWAARRRILERFQYLGIVIFLVAVFGVDFLLPTSLADHAST
jgi:hypothetical protein